ncbi:acylphosphatase [Candidatus Kaiserbacteria bacterium]|nr:acylphosphatase [Candidatus Kaiserbacteria bacterium]
MPQAAFIAVVSGRVQLVMYRDFAQRKASRLGITGEVENLSDGTVRVTAEGPTDKLKSLIALLKKGSLLSAVMDVSVRWQEPKGAFAGFTIKYS